MNLLEHCGPICHPGRIVTIQPDGIQTREYPPNLPESAPEAWQASWIWLDAAVSAEHQTGPYTVFCDRNGQKPAVALFRKKIVLDTAVKKVTAWVSGDTKYRLYVNGKMAGRGPAAVGGDYGNQQPPDWWFYDSYDLTPLFQAGENLILAEVLLGPVVQADYSMGHGGFLFQADMELCSQKHIQVVSDADWKGTLERGFQEPGRYDSRAACIHPQDVDFDDQDWPSAQIQCAAAQGKWKLTPREIPPLAEARLFPCRVIVPFVEFQKRALNLASLSNTSLPSGRDCATLLPGGPLTLWFEFERELTGHPQFCVEGAAGTVLELGLQEIAGQDHRVETYILRDGLQHYECIELHAFQYIRLTVTFPGGGACQTPLKLYALAANFTSFPVQYPGQFACSDPMFNELWQTARWTTQMCMQSYHLDSPIHQEGLGCTGDYMIEALVSQFAFGETRLARQDLLRTLYLLRQKNGHMFHTSYSLLLVQMLVDYWVYTGDEEVVRRMLPAVQDVLALFHGYVGKSGLVTEAPNYMFMDWVDVDGYNLHHPPCVLGQGYLSALYYRALQNTTRLCQLSGAQAEAALYTARAESLRDAFIRELWVPEKGLFCDGKPFRSQQPPNPWLPADKDQLYFSRHTNALAVAYQLAPPEWAESIIQRMMKDDALPVVQPYFMHFVFEAIHQAGLFKEYGFRELRRWKALLDEHPTSLKECWDTGDYSHAWGGTPAYQFFARVLGITPSAPGFHTVHIQPELGDLDWVEGQAPTPLGIIRCHWERKNGQVSGKISIPAAVTARLSLAVSAEDTQSIRLNGAPLSENLSHRTNTLDIWLRGGEHQVEWTERRSASANL